MRIISWNIAGIKRRRAEIEEMVKKRKPCIFACKRPGVRMLRLLTDTVASAIVPTNGVMLQLIAAMDYITLSLSQIPITSFGDLTTLFISTPMCHTLREYMARVKTFVDLITFTPPSYEEYSK